MRTYIIYSEDQSLGHRGPDAKGFISFNASNKNITLLHTRLSILDLDERSNQPFQYKDSIIVFDELYNYIGWRNGEYKALTEVFKEDEFVFKSFNLRGYACVIQIK